MNGAELAIKEVNDAGGIDGRKVVLVRLDDQGDPKQGTLVAQRFCDDDAHAGGDRQFQQRRHHPVLRRL